MFNPRYLDFARHWGFDISACAPGRGNEKDCVSYCMSSVRLASIAAHHLGVALAAAFDDARVGRQLVEAARAIRADPALQ